MKEEVRRKSRVRRGTEGKEGDGLTERVNRGRTHKNDAGTCPDRSTASTTTCFPSRLGLHSPTTQHKTCQLSKSMTITPSGTRLHPVESHSLPFRRVFPCGECGGRCDDESPSPFLSPVKSPHSSHPSPKRHPSRPHRLPNPLHINANKSPDFSNSFKRVMLDPSNDSHRTICPVLFDGMHARRQSKRVEKNTNAGGRHKSV